MFGEPPRTLSGPLTMWHCCKCSSILYKLGSLLPQCLSTHPWWTSTSSTLQMPKSRSTKSRWSSQDRDRPPQMGLTRSSSAPSPGMDTNPPMTTAAGTHTPAETGITQPERTTIRTDTSGDAFKRQMMDRYCVKSLKHTMYTVITSWANPPGVSSPLGGVDTSEGACCFTTGTVTLPSRPLLWLLLSQTRSGPLAMTYVMSRIY